MLQLSSHGSRAARSSSHHICRSCQAVLRSQFPPWSSLSPTPAHVRCATTDAKDGASTPARKAKTRSRTRGKARAKTSPPEAKQLLLWQQTLDVLKDIQASYGQVSAAEGEPGPAQKKAKKGKTPKGKDGKDAQDEDTEVAAQPQTLPKSLRTEFRSLAALGSSKGGSPESQAKLFAGALGVLKSVLATQSGAGGDAQTAPATDKTSKKTSFSGKTSRADVKLRKIKSDSPPGTPSRGAGSATPTPTPTTPTAAAAAAAAAAVTVAAAAAVPAAAGTESTRSSDSFVESESAPSTPAAPSSRAPSTPAPKKTPGPIIAKPGVLDVHKINSRELQLQPIERAQPPVPRLSYGLDRALFNPGVYHMQDPRSRVFNFDPYLASIMPIREFDFNALKQYVTSSKDNTLISMAAAYNKKYSGSTSSMTAMLSHFHYLLSSWRPINPIYTSRAFSPDSYNYTWILRAPAASFLHLKEGTYAIDADKEFDSANILSMLGKSMEKLLTLPKDEFERYRVANSDQITEEERNAEEAYHYTTLGDFMMRSQLDAHDPRLPGSGMFDLKTRAVVSIRMDAKDFHKGLGYEIRNRIGQWESFEREYFDMIRSAFLKYSLQVRMGRMDGIFVAFHNTERIFGFQYIPIAEMDQAIHGQNTVHLGDREFKLSLHLLNKVLDKATAEFPGKSLRLHIETRPSDPPFMYIFAKPVKPEEIEDVQSTNRAAIEEFERNILGLDKDKQAAEEEQIDEDVDLEQVAEAEEAAEETGIVEDLRDQEMENEDVWEGMRLKVEETMDNDALGATSVREALEEALEQSGLLRARSLEESHRYVDALLEAIISADPESASDSTEEKALLEKVQDAVVSEERSSASSSEDLADDGQQAGQEQDQVEKTSTSADEELGSRARSEENDTEESDELATEPLVVEPPQTSSSTSGSLTLKDLIIKLAKQVEAAPVEEKSLGDNGPTSQSAADLSKLRRFERILSEMMASSDRPAAEGAPGEAAAEPAAEETQTRDGARPTDQATTTPPSEPAIPSDEGALKSGQEDELLGLILTVRNKVNGQYVARPENINSQSSWVVEYALQKIEPQRAQALYDACKRRRQKLLQPDEDKASEWGRMFQGKLENYSKKGRLFRAKENAVGRTKPVRVYGLDQELKWEDVFPDAVETGSVSMQDVGEEQL